MDNRKQEIIESALKRFSHYGFHKTTMNEIADDLRITKANLYYYYADKQALIVDVLCHISTCSYEIEEKIIATYDNNLIEVLFKLLEIRSGFVKKYYVLHLSENLEWIKGLEFTSILNEFHNRDVANIKVLLKNATAAGEVKLLDIDSASHCYVEVIKGLGIIHKIADILTGLPDIDKVDMSLESQKRATEFIFEGKIVNKQS